MQKVAVFGNGESRIGVDLNQFRSDHALIGCNAIYRDFSVDHLVCCDRKMIEEVISDPNTKETLIYVREEQYHHFRKIKKNKKIQLLPDLPYQGDRRADVPTHWGSGSYAVLIACLTNPCEISVIGFDLWGDEAYVNNVYKGTKNYRSAESNAVDPNYWIYQIGKLISIYQDIKFKIYNRSGWKMPEHWQQKNVEKLDVSCFKNKYLV